ncbi:cytochrome C5 [Microbacterium sp. VKM Ac-2923]|uniref:cytochrome C5 n=1 Tax=Microbacterium sp. VKM Ac-2923 TaxID=2929476 RepID=UPI001FB30C4C|nr:cytochrome C5 [Microbacterium sp. VKM Ac-2923]MCJ1706595.1 cytochrome C5 [Microbacterium sp. VKM Ac-2923]
MTEAVLNDLLRRVTESGLLDDVQIDEDSVIGVGHLDAAGVEVEVDLDPELEDEETPDLDAIMAGLKDVLSVSEDRWRAIVEEIASDIEDALDDGELDADVDLRTDLEAIGVGVFADAIIVVFAGETSFPDALVHVQLTPELEIEDIEIIGDEDEDDDED